MNSASFSLCGDMSLITNERACRAQLREIQRVTWRSRRRALLGTVKRERREADRKLVAGCYLCDRGRNVNPGPGIDPAQAVALGNRLAIEGCRRGVAARMATGR